MKLSDATKIYRGSGAVSKVYKGASQVWSATAPSHWNAQGTILDPLETAHLLCLPLTADANATKGSSFTETYQGFGDHITYSADGALFNGAFTTRLERTTDTDFNFGTNNFAIGWVEKVTNSANRAVFVLNTADGNAGGMLLFWDSTIYISSNGSSWDIANGAASGVDRRVTDETRYMMLVRKGSNFYFYKNGTQTGTFSSASAIYYNSSHTLGLGFYANSGGMYGYLKNFNVWNGLDASFVPADLASAFYNSGTGVDYIP